MFESIKMFKFSVYYLSIIVLFQVVSQFLNFLNFLNFGEGEKRLVGLRLAAPQAKSLSSGMFSGSKKIENN